MGLNKKISNLEDRLDKLDNINKKLLDIIDMDDKLIKMLEERVSKLEKGSVDDGK